MDLQTILICSIFLYGCTCIISSCNQYKGNEIKGSNLIYTTAKLLDSSQQRKVLDLYSNLSEIGDYNIDLVYKIYANKFFICNKEDTSIQTINSSNDIWMCFDSFYMVACNKLWQLVIKCGTFVEVHRPFDSQVLISLNLQFVSWIQNQKGIQMINMDLTQLCAGMYHLWFVYYTRMGKFLKGVKTMYITYPSCQC